jgi:hypothetical protein
MKLKLPLGKIWRNLCQRSRLWGLAVRDRLANRTTTDAHDHALRRVPPNLVVSDPKAPDGRRASSAAFKDDNDGSPMSAYLWSVVAKLNLQEASVAYGKSSGWGVASIPVQVLTAEDQVTTHVPIVAAAVPHPCDPAHAEVAGDKSAKSRRERIARSSPLVFTVP